jgi:hypothetical protein
MKRVLFLFSVLICLLAVQDIRAGGSSPPGLKLEVGIYDLCPVFAAVDAPQVTFTNLGVPADIYVTAYQGSVCQGEGIMNTDLIYIISNTIAENIALMPAEYTSLGYSMWN